MSRRARRLVALWLLATAMGVSVGADAYTAIGAERRVSVAVAAPDEAYLGFGDDLQCGRGGGVGDNRRFVRNQFRGDATIDRIEVRVTTVGGHLRVGTGGTASRLATGESVRLTFDDSYGPGDAAAIQVKPPVGNASAADALRVELIAATGADVRVADATHTYDVRCPVGPGGRGSVGRTGGAPGRSGGRGSA
jgi:hypothetical protein